MRLFFSFLVLVFFSDTYLLRAQQVESISDTTFVNLKDYSDNFVYDMKYATEDNFLKAILLTKTLFQVQKNQKNHSLRK